jgi:hypothetical protein
MRLLIVLFLAGQTCLVAQTRVIHVLVALCDNKYQGIVPVPAKIGNGQDPANNLYWGCCYGVKTFFKKQKDWKLVKRINNPTASIYERLVFKYTASGTWLVADAYNGSMIKQTISDFLDYSAGLQKLVVSPDSLKIEAGGSSALVCYVGHNGLMDFSLEKTPANSDGLKRDVAIFACASKPYFKEAVIKAGANPLIWTTHLMCPEAYTLLATVNGWIKKDQPSVVRESVAQTYNQYHKCGIRGARNLFVTGF